MPPLALAAIPIIAGAVGTIGATTAAGTAAAALATAAAAGTAVAGYSASRYQQQVAQNNANTATANAAYTEQAGQAAVQKQQMQNAQQMGAIKATMAANGLNIGSGTNTNIAQSQGVIGQENVENTNANFQKQAYNQLGESVNYENTASVYGAKGTQALLTGAGNIGKNILGDASTVSSKYASWQNQNAGSQLDSTISDMEND